MVNPERGEIWFADLDPTRGNEQGGKRPCLIVSATLFNRSFLELAVVLPLTSKKKNFPTHVPISAHESGLKLQSFVKCEDVRSISKERLARRIGRVSSPTMRVVEDRLKIILNF